MGGPGRLRSCGGAAVRLSDRAARQPDRRVGLRSPLKIKLDDNVTATAVARRVLSIQGSSMSAEQNTGCLSPSMSDSAT